MSMKAVTLV